MVVRAAVAHHRAIERLAKQDRRSADDHPQAPAAHLERAAELDLHLLLRPSHSQGSGRRSQLSGCSRCQPSSIVCLKMPYS